MDLGPPVVLSYQALEKVEDDDPHRDSASDAALADWPPPQHYIAIALKDAFTNPGKEGYANK